mgnify:CR=1 FL=1
MGALLVLLMVTVSVSKDGLYYTVIINCVNQKGEKVAGFYKDAIFYEK